ncbi:MAG: hypothetical protein ACP5UA_00145 [Candidatus Hydrogenedens sp.]
MKFIVTCPYCSKEVLLPTSIIGQKVLCPNCQRLFMVTIIEPVEKNEDIVVNKSKLAYRPDLEQSDSLLKKMEKDLEEMEVEDVLDCFYALEELISRYIEEDIKDNDTKTALLIITSKKQIDLSKEVKEHIQQTMPGIPLPAHLGYDTLSDIRERQGQYEECISLCQQAIEEGWTGDWQNRMNRCRKTSMIKRKEK